MAPREAGAALLLLLSFAAARAATQQRALPLPLTTGAAIVQTLSFEGGDREAVHLVKLASTEGLRFEWSFTEAHTTGDTIRQVFRYLEATADVASAHRLRVLHAPNEPEAHPGYTMHALSRAVYQRLRSGAADSLQIMAVERPAGAHGFAALGLRSNREVPVRWRGTLSPVGRGAIPFPLLVNGQRVDVPAIRVRGSFTARQGRWEPEFLVLADSTYPLILKWIGAFQEPGNVLQTVRIDVPTHAPAARGGGTAAAGVGGGVLDPTLERTLASACRVELPGIYFAFNSAELDPASDRAIASIAAILTRHPNWTATLEGHTDSIGSAASNLALSQRRVEAVRRRLIEAHKVSPARIRTAGLGSARPRESNATIEGRARNRRVELVRECAGAAGGTR
jgi:outer membrane protein OmpA-like peptidoglycan-associated protein